MISLNAFYLWAAISVVAQSTPDVPSAPPGEEKVLTLDEAIARTRDNNIDLRMGKERLAKASILSSKAWSVLLPTVSAQATGTFNNLEIILPFGLPEELRPLFETINQLDPSQNIQFPEPQLVTLQRQTQASAQVSFNWPLLNGRAIPLLLNAYTYEDLAKVSYQQFEEVMRNATTLAYYNALSVQRQLELRQRALVTARHHLELAKARVEVGGATEVEVLRSETEVATEEQAVIQLENSERLAKLALAVLMNAVNEQGEAESFVVVRPENNDDPRRDINGRSLLERAYEHRLDLKQRRLELTIADRNKTDTWAKFFPSLVGSGAWNWSEVAGFSGENVTWSLSLSLVWNIFEGGIVYWELQEREHDIQTANLMVQKVRQDIARQVREAKLNLASAESIHLSAQKRVELARRSAELIRSQYELGLSTQLDLIDAERTLADAETAETLAQLQVDVNRVSLERVTLVPPTDPTALSQSIAQ